MSRIESPWDERADSIMKLVHDMAADEVIRSAIIQAMADAYSRGFNVADRNPRQPESMGR